MISTRRSFVKGLAAVVGAIPLPGVVKRLTSSLAPEEQTLEDAEDILRGLIARCVNGPIDGREARLVGSFIRRMRPTDAQQDAWARLSRAPWASPEFEELKEKIPVCVRFVTGFTNGARPKPWFKVNFDKLADEVMPDVVASVQEQNKRTARS